MCGGGMSSHTKILHHSPHTITHTHTTDLWHFFRDYPGEPVPEKIFWTFRVQRKITEADTLTIWLDATPFWLISDPPPSSPHFCTGCPSCHNPPTLSWVGTGTKYAGLHTQWHGSYPVAWLGVARSLEKDCSVKSVLLLGTVVARWFWAIKLCCDDRLVMVNVWWGNE